jgi:predicted lipoprotein with Yx(FWY)xxD motif
LSISIQIRSYCVDIISSSIKEDNLSEEKMKFKKTGYWLALNLVVMFSFILAACSPAPAVQPTAAPTQPPAAAPTVAPTAAAASEVTFTLKVATNPTLGSYLTDQDGRTVYMFTQDKSTKSSCDGGCAKAWPPLEGIGAAGTGVDASLIGTGSRTDGSKQVTYKGMLLYYWAGDKKSGDINGQNIQGSWFVLSPSGDIIKTALSTAAAPAAAATVAPSPVPPTPMAFTLKVAKDPILGDILTDQDGRTIYMFAEDIGGAVTCYDTCAKYWPPLVGTATAGTGVDASLIGTTPRKDGLSQVTYKGMPIYYFLKDKKPSDVFGQGVLGTWYVLSPSGDIIKTALPTAVPTTAAAAKSAPGSSY